MRAEANSSGGEDSLAGFGPDCVTPHRNTSALYRCRGGMKNGTHLLGYHCYRGRDAAGRPRPIRPRGRRSHPCQGRVVQPAFERQGPHRPLHDRRGGKGMEV